MTNKYVWLGLIAVAIIAIFGLIYPGTPTPLDPFGAAATSTTQGAFRATGGFYTPAQVIADGIATFASIVKTGALVEGGGCTSTTTPASAVLSANDFDTENCLYSTMTVGSVTLTFPAAGNAAYTSWNLATPGRCRQLLFVNATTTDPIRLTLAAGANMQINNASTSLVLSPEKNGASSTALMQLCMTGTAANPSYTGYLFNGSR